VRSPILVALLCLLADSACGMGLLEAFRAAQNNDADFRAQRLDRDASQLNADIARAGLLPNVSASSIDTANSGERTQTGGTGTADVTQPLSYQARLSSVILRQPLYYAEGLVRYRQGQQQAVYADTLLESKRLELAQNVTTAYFDVLLARDNVALGEAELVAAQEQTRLAERRFTGGEGTRTEIAEAQARKYLAEAKLIEARDQVDVAESTLARITGVTTTRPRPLRSAAIALALEPRTLGEWLDSARQRNADVLLLRLQTEYAQLEIEKNRSGHLPRIDLIASVTDARNDTVNTLNTSSIIRAAGVQLTIPIYSGGAVVAGTDQAVINREKSLASLDSAIRTAVEKTRKQYLASVSASGRIAAYEKAVQASDEALKGNQLGFQAGIRTNLDVLNSQGQLYTARRDLAQARYVYLTGIITLKATAGMLTEDSIAEVDALLDGGPANPPSPSVAVETIPK
jgi:protease secretion system outer membrane protein